MRMRGRGEGEEEGEEGEEGRRGGGGGGRGEGGARGGLGGGGGEEGLGRGRRRGRGKRRERRRERRGMRGWGRGRERGRRERRGWGGGGEEGGGTKTRRRKTEGGGAHSSKATMCRASGVRGERFGTGGPVGSGQRRPVPGHPLEGAAVGCPDEVGTWLGQPGRPSAAVRASGDLRWGARGRSPRVSSAHTRVTAEPVIPESGGL